ncbi:hypothetical protein DRW71_08285 [Salmonella enterica subsp. diarizonae]|nr:hypothetical protein [Salmonella enterica]ECC9189774.1 hypothetical protein [Salmonella enterica subsp. diarizonae]EGL0765513.1 hypothetical protein [Salmonella enterica subsp. enterica]EDL5585115.1 hypothetical protein [Salmonella enterica]EHM9007301.1 hypothetical protein [Salmonella enterica]
MTIKKIPQLDFCRLERASKLIGCETEDLLQWALTGAIEICVLLNNAVSSLSINMNEDEILNLITDNDSFIKSNVNIGSSSFRPIKGIEINEYYIPHKDNDDLSKSTIYCLASGPWAIKNQLMIIELLSQGKTEIGMFSLSAADYNNTENYLEEDESYLINGITEDILTKNGFGEIKICDVWITWEQIQKIQNHIGKPMPKGEFKTPSKKENAEIKPHPRTESSAKARLQILEAAVKIKENNVDDFNNICIKRDGSYNITKWAEYIIDRPHIFPDGRLPLTDKQTIMNVISSAYNKKTPIVH